MDNAAIHSARLVKQMFQEWETSLCLNAPYNPKNNPAELIIGLVKKYIRIQYYLNEDELTEAIGKAFRRISAYHVKNMCKHAFKIINIK